MGRASSSSLWPLFPGGFKQVRSGFPKTKKPKWTLWRKEHLILFMEECAEENMSQEGAAKLYIQRHCPERSSAKGIVAEFKRAEKWKREGHLTASEKEEYDRWMDDEMDRYFEMEREIRQGK